MELMCGMLMMPRLVLHYLNYELQNWFDSLLHIGADYGCHPERTMCVVVVNDSYLPLAHDLIAMMFVFLPVIGCWVASLEIQIVLPLFLLSVLLIGLPLFGLDQCDSTPIGLFCFYSVYPAQMDLLTVGCS